MRPRGFRAFHPRILGGRPTGKIARHLPGEFLAREPYHQVLQRADILQHVGASESGDHVGDVLAAEAFSFLNRYIPDFILETFDDTNLIGRVGNAGEELRWPPIKIVATSGQSPTATLNHENASGIDCA
ncbi:hypothetical protein [Bradyrhizobium sp. McL0615]|uniref:hypothetical protein n=1 Tax=Bradyrhizobium sp. McL0615 TaxID=3415673 RepID=UPI003CF301E1